MKLDLRKTERRVRDKDVLSAPRAEVISRAWQAVAFIEELRDDLSSSVGRAPAGTPRPRSRAGRWCNRRH